MTTPEQTSTSTEPSTTGRSMSNRYAWLIALFSLVVALTLGTVGAICGYQLLRQLNAQNQQLQMAQIQLQQQQTALTTLQQQIRQALAPARHWQLAQAEYFVWLANFYLQTEANTAAADQLLGLAGASLRGSADPALTNIQQLLAVNRAAVAASSQPNASELIVQLDALNQQIAQLPVPASPTPHSTAPATASPLNRITTFWQRGWDSLVTYLRRIVQVHHTDQPVLLTASQRDDIQYAIQLKLLQAEWAVLRRQSPVYQQSLQQVVTWLKQYYPQSKALKAVLENVTKLQAAVIAPALPDISATLTVIQNARQQTLPAKNEPAPNAPPATPAAPTPPPPSSEVPKTKATTILPPAPESIAS